jgi:hypothetical protein
VGYKTLEAAKEIAKMPNGLAVLRVLQAHGIDEMRTSTWEICSIERLIDEVESNTQSKSQRKKRFLQGMWNFGR